eukprot:TRINITY_DN9941_c1_g1_i4.p1 TRINITY_DN9941_c1_g1~~TRINITY_DN9941_c1_g1_i4.p1  ORF type:complete len:687 (-),score=159.35 TRINITY_DN9941_c1_g1_i4:792-2852(-)
MRGVWIFTTIALFYMTKGQSQEDYVAVETGTEDYPAYPEDYEPEYQYSYPYDSENYGQAPDPTDYDPTSYGSYVQLITYVNYDNYQSYDSITNQAIYTSTLSDLNVTKFDYFAALQILGELKSPNTPQDLAQAISFAANNGDVFYTPQEIASALKTAIVANPELTVFDFGKAVALAAYNGDVHKYRAIDYAEAIVIAKDAGYVVTPQKLALALAHAAFEGDVHHYSPQSYANALATVSGINNLVGIEDFAYAVAYAAKYGDLHHYNPQDYAEAILIASNHTSKQLTALDFAQAVAFAAKYGDSHHYLPQDYAEAIVIGSEANFFLTPMEFAQAIAHAAFLGDKHHYYPQDYARAMQIAIQISYRQEQKRQAEQGMIPPSELLGPMDFARAVTIAAFQGDKHHYPPESYATAMVEGSVSNPKVTPEDFAEAVAYAAHYGDKHHYAPNFYGEAMKIAAPVGYPIQPQAIAFAVAYIAQYGDRHHYPPQDFGEAMLIAINAGQNLTAQDFGIAIATAAHDGDRHHQQSPQEYAEAVAKIVNARKYTSKQGAVVPVFAPTPLDISKAIVIAAARGDVFLSPLDIADGFVAAIQYGCCDDFTVVDFGTAVQIAAAQGDLFFKPIDFGYAVSTMYGVGLEINPTRVAEALAFVANNRDVFLTPEQVADAVISDYNMAAYTSVFDSAQKLAAM